MTAINALKCSRYSDMNMTGNALSDRTKTKQNKKDVMKWKWLDCSFFIRCYLNTVTTHFSLLLWVCTRIENYTGYLIFYLKSEMHQTETTTTDYFDTMTDRDRYRDSMTHEERCRQVEIFRSYLRHDHDLHQSVWKWSSNFNAKKSSHVAMFKCIKCTIMSEWTVYSKIRYAHAMYYCL